MPSTHGGHCPFPYAVIISVLNLLHHCLHRPLKHLLCFRLLSRCSSQQCQLHLTDCFSGKYPTSAASSLVGIYQSVQVSQTVTKDDFIELIWRTQRSEFHPVYNYLSHRIDHFLSLPFGLLCKTNRLNLKQIILLIFLNLHHNLHSPISRNFLLFFRESILVNGYDPFWNATFLKEHFSYDIFCALV